MKNIKNVFRKVTVMVIMLSLVLQLLPLSAGAGNALVPDVKTEENVVTVSKTAERVADDKWEVTLSVEALQDLYTKPLELVVLYDISGSMAWCTQEEHRHNFTCRKNGCEKTEHTHSGLAGNLCKGTTLEQSRQYILGTALREFIAELNDTVEGASISVCTFGNKGYTDVPMTKLSDDSVDAICESIPVEHKKHFAEMTNIRSGILNAQEQFSDNPNTTKMMLILCDGEYTGSLPAVAADNLKAEGVIIDCVGFLYTSSTLEELASEGRYHHVEDGIDLETVLGSYLDSTSAMITDIMGDAVELVEINSAAAGDLVISDDRTTLSWVPEGGFIAEGEKDEITYTVKLKDEYVVVGEYDIALNNSAAFECTIADGTEYNLDFPVPMAHYEVGSLTISASGLPAELTPEIYYDKMITDFTAKQFVFEAAKPCYTDAEGVIYQYVKSVYTDNDGNTSEFDGLATTSVDAESGVQTIVHQYELKPAEKFAVSYIYVGDVPYNADPLPETKEYEAGEVVTVADDPSEVEGYVFLGWTVEGAEEADGQFTMPENEVVIKGVWEKKCTPPAIKYSVTYHYTGIVPFGAPLPPAIKFYDQLTPGIAVEDIPVMDDFVFVGWFTVDAFVVDGEFTMPMKHVQFYGHWVPKAQYKVEYKYEGKVPFTADKLPEDAWYKAGETVTVAPTPSEVPGYTFKGWTVVGADAADGSFEMPHNCVVIKGVWEKECTPPVIPAFKYSVTYHYTGIVPFGAPVPPAIEFYDQLTPDIAVKDVPVMDDFVFVGWFTVDAFVIDGEFTMPMKHVQFYGHWVPKVQHKVEYVYLGEVPLTADKLPEDAWYKAGETVTVAPTPSEVPGYIFKGWYVVGACENDGAFIMPHHNVIIKGIWDRIDCPCPPPIWPPIIPPVTEPVETDPVVTEPAETDPVVTEPEETDPVVTEPEETDPVVTEPEETDPVVTEPEETDPVVTEPEETDPVVTEPEETDPIETEPVVTDPEVTDPVDPDPDDPDIPPIIPPIIIPPVIDPDLYEVTYKYEGEIPENAPALPASMKYLPGVVVILASEPSAEGYFFKGWTVETVEVNNRAFLMPEADVVVVGTWEKIPEDVITYSVVYQDGVEEVEIAVPDATYSILGGTVYTVSPIIPVYDGFTFNGWISSVDGQLYNPGDTFVVNSDVVLVASWSENPNTSDAFVAIALMFLCACAVATITAKSAKRAR